MKMLSILLVIAALLLSACAGQPAQPQSTDVSDRYKAAVHSNAEKRGAEVVWLNPPAAKDLKKYEEDDDS